jgi:hypothetical protein
MAQTTTIDEDLPDFTPGSEPEPAPDPILPPVLEAVPDPVVEPPAYHDLTASVEGAGGRPDEWDGVPTALTIAVTGLVRDHRQVRVGETVVFNASRAPDGTWRGPEAEHVIDLWRMGMFAGTKAHATRMRRQTVRDEELGIYDEPELVDPDDPSKGYKGGAKGLAPKTDAELAATLRSMLGGGHADMLRRERQEAREDTRPDPRQWPGAQSQRRTV